MLQLEINADLKPYRMDIKALMEEVQYRSASRDLLDEDLDDTKGRGLPHRSSI